MGLTTDSISNGAEDSIDPAVRRVVTSLTHGPGRRIVGLVGPPAAGKSTMAGQLAALFNGAIACVPMDGFHLAQYELERLGRTQRKGAPDTFDALGYRDLLMRIRRGFDYQETVYAPDFDRALEEPIAARIAIDPTTPLIMTEGNYLLLEDEPWPQIAAQLDEIWFLDIDTSIREAWLMARHKYFGRSEAEARAWIAATDRPNAERIETGQHRADRRLIWDGDRFRWADADSRAVIG